MTVEVMPRCPVSDARRIRFNDTVLVCVADIAKSMKPKGSNDDKRHLAERYGRLNPDRLVKRDWYRLAGIASAYAPVAFYWISQEFLVDIIEFFDNPPPVRRGRPPSSLVASVTVTAPTSSTPSLEDRVANLEKMIAALAPVARTSPSARLVA